MTLPVPSSFQRPRLLILGCGDVGMRLLPLVRQRFRVFAVTTQPERCAALRAAGAVPILADLDRPASGVYGDCGGALIDETRGVAPHNARAWRRVDSERCLRAWAIARRASVAILRVPGIYAADRLPLKRLQQGTPALQAQDDVYTNHIHADDLARIVALALWRARPQRVYHAVDDSEMKMADYFDIVADAFALARPPRLARAALEAQVSTMLLSFMSESRRMDNARIKRELGVRLSYPQVAPAVAAMALVK